MDEVTRVAYKRISLGVCFLRMI
ncbi:hypothetical protein Zm00014a_028159 [Zea mays]|uniref:Uncharacterized protein n=1 Tax=Zea mays TaxID=4577 RepID=A0A3L6GC06_MAIZE|nr:hypothetical protein Zm00014a_028159 [Zea mays]